MLEGEYQLCDSRSMFSAQHISIGRLVRVPLREVWKHEALDFTAWLRDNIDVLNDVIDTTVVNVEREQSAGTFSVDLVGEDDAGNPVVIENQLEKSDHDHLGKLITYLTALEAKTAVWIVADPRPEHVTAIAWLNQSTPASFYLLKVEAVRIGDSAAAPLLTRIVGPSSEGREVGETKKDIAERYVLRERFWTTLLARARSVTQLHASISPGQYSWIGTSAGRRGINFNYSVRQHDATVELYIDRGNQEENKAIFDRLFVDRTAIEATFGDELAWERLEARRACRIKASIPSGGYRDSEEQWPVTQDAMIQTMIRLEHALRPYIDQLPR